MMEMLYMSCKKCLYIVIIIALTLLFIWYVQPSNTKTDHLLHKIEIDHFQSLPRMDKPQLLDTNIQISEIAENHDYEVHPGLRPTVQKCLHSDPPMLEEEFLPSFNGSKNGFVCSMDYKRRIMWDVNFNIERHFSFCDHRSLCKKENVTGIPKILHFIWTTEMIPKLFVKNLRKFRKFHQEWKLHFWTLNAGREFIEKHEPFLLKYFDNFKRDVDRADVLRYVVLFYYGGAYFDIDSYPVRPLDSLAKRYDCIVGPEPIENAVILLKTRSILANSAIMCVPQHAFTRKLIDSIPVFGKRLAGPIFFSNVFNIYLQDKLFPPKRKHKTSDLQNEDKTTKLVDHISVLRHEYFEYDLNKVVNISQILGNECKKYESDIEEYLTVCKSKVSRSTKINCQIPTSKQGWSTKLFQACVEWLSHGGSKRTNGRTQVYVKHEHYGTYTKSNFVKHNPGPNITEILPKAVLHV